MISPNAVQIWNLVSKKGILFSQYTNVFKFSLTFAVRNIKNVE